MKKFIFLAGVSLFLASCTTLDGKLATEIGAHISHAISKQGAPTQTATIPTGTVYTWIQRRGGMECWITLTTNKEGIVESYSHKGCG